MASGFIYGKRVCVVMLNLVTYRVVIIINCEASFLQPDIVEEPLLCSIK